MIACGREQRPLNMAKKMLARTHIAIQGYYVNELAPCAAAVISLNRQPKSTKGKHRRPAGGQRL